MAKKEKVKEILKYCGCTETASEEKSKKIDTQGLEKMKEKDPCNTMLINDAIHGPVVLNSLLKEIIDTPEFQRLRYIKQLGGGSYVYPGANHTRFDHSIGVCHIAGEFGRFLKNQLEDEQSRSTSITSKELLCLQIAGLCHDLGHGPFSHTFEHRILHRMPEFATLKHEEISLKIFDSIMKHPKVLVEFVYMYELGKDEVFLIKKMIHPKYSSNNDPTLSEEMTKKEFLYQIVANKESGIDVDKWDYFTRDCHCLGIAMDFQWQRCMQLSRICKWKGKFHICFRDKELDNLYGMGRTRSTLHRKVYVHKTKVAVEEMFARAIVKVKEVPLMAIISETQDMSKFKWEDVKRKSIKDAILSLKSGNLELFLALTDTSVTTLIMNWRPNTEDEQIKYGKAVLEAQRILRNIKTRDLYHLVVAKKFPKSDWNEERQKKIDEKTKSSDLSADIFIKEEDLKSATFAEIVIISCGSEKKSDPVEGVLFYKKAEPTQAIEWKDLTQTQQLSTLALPKHFTEYEIRVYYTKSGESEAEAKKIQTKISDKFENSQWLRDIKKIFEHTM